MKTEIRGQVSALQEIFGELALGLLAAIGVILLPDLIQQAIQQARMDADKLTAQHNALEAQANGSPTTSDGAQDTASRLTQIKQRSEQRQLLGIYADRIQTQQQLANVYGKWADQVFYSIG